MAYAKFSEIQFGFASAEEESVQAPDLLTGGYLDFEDIISQTMSGRYFLVLGHKGSGKSSVAEHLRLKTQADPLQFCEIMQLADFPFGAFKKIISGDTEPESKYPTAWAWILLLKILDSFSRDEGSPTQGSIDFLKALGTLKELGLMPIPELKHVVLTSSRNSFKVNLATVLETAYEGQYEDRSLQLPYFVEALKTLVLNFRSESRHTIIIDGLDDILTKKDLQFQSLAALLFEVARLNRDFKRSGSPIHIIVLCRTDIFERLPDGNKNKLGLDSAFHIDWYRNTRNPAESRLIKLVNLRASLQDRTIRDIFDEFFPSMCEGRAIEEFLLELTRHTPRDFIQLLKYLQGFDGGRRLVRDDILSGVRDYSIKYFLPEIKDELVGYVPEAHVEIAFELLGSPRKREFLFSELRSRQDSHSRFKDIDLEAFISALFDCSAIGNIQNRHGGNTYYTFKHRNQNATFNVNERLLLHRGLWKAMNLI